MKQKRPVVAVLINEIFESYEIMLWFQFLEIAKKLKIHLVAFPGRQIEFKYGERYKNNIIYDFVNKNEIDAIVMVSSTISNYVSLEDFSKFHQKFGSFFMISIGIDIPQLPSIIVDNRSGMMAAVRHLIRDHGFQRLGFVTGPRGHQEADLRLQAYLDVLAEHNIPKDDALIEEGDFFPNSGIRAVNKFTQSGQTIPDAIVFSNDRMAFAALGTLRTLGISVPTDIAIVGFDNTEEASLNPIIPLTTVAQPFDKIAKKTFECILNYIDGSSESYTEPILYPTELVVRSSCGCLPAIVSSPGNGPSSHLFANEISTDRSEVSQVLAGVEDVDKASTEKLIEVLQETYRFDLKKDHFLNELNRALIVHIRQGRHPCQWHAILDRMLDFCSINSLIEDEVECFSLFESARDLVSNYIQIKAAKKVRQFDFTNTRRDVANRLAAASSLPDLLKTIMNEFPRLRISSYCIYLYEDEISLSESSKWHKPDRMRLVTAYHSKSHVKVLYDDRLTQSDQLIPDGFITQEKAAALIVLPLFHRDIQIGLFVFEYSDEINFTLLKPLHGQISNAIRYINVLEENQIQKNHLAIKRLELEKYSSALKKMQYQLVKAQVTEEQANRQKTKFLANLSHELRTPLNAINGVANLLILEAFKKDEQILDELESALKTVDRLKIIEPSESSQLDELAEWLRHFKSALLQEQNGAGFFISNLQNQLKFNEILDPAPDCKAKVLTHLSKVAELLDSEEAETLFALRKIPESGQYLLRLIDLVIDIAKLEQGRITPSPKTINLDKFLTRIVEYSKTQLTSSSHPTSVVIECNVAPDSPPDSVFDPVIVGKVLENFVSNAIKCTETGTIQITASSNHTESIFSVNDTGSGIAACDKRFVFNEFAGIGPTRDIPSARLGLVLCKKLVECHRGSIGFSSKLGEGSTFWFKIPLS